MIHLFAKILKILNSETDPYQISLAVALAMIIGFTPLMSLHNLAVFLFVLILRVNLSAFMLSWALFSGIAYLLDPLFHHAGLALLTADSFEGLWTALYNIPVFKIERFYNSVVMGSLIVSAALFFPVYFLSKSLIARYRRHVLTWVRKTRIMQMIKLSKFYKAYTSLSLPGDGS